MQGVRSAGACLERSQPCTLVRMWADAAQRCCSNLSSMLPDQPRSPVLSDVDCELVSQCSRAFLPCLRKPAAAAKPAQGTTLPHGC